MAPLDSRIPLMVNPVPVPDLLGMQQQRQQMAQRQMSMQDLLQQRSEHAAKQRKQQAIEQALSTAFDENGQLDYDKAVKAVAPIDYSVAMEIAKSKPKAKEPRVELKVGANGEYIGVPVKEGATGVKVPPKPEKPEKAPTLTPFQKATIERWKKLDATKGGTQGNKAELAAYKANRLAQLKNDLRVPIRVPVVDPKTKQQIGWKNQALSPSRMSLLRQAATKDIEEYKARLDAGMEDLSGMSTDDLLQAFSEDEGK